MTTDLTRHVNLRYGVDNEGNTVIGPQRPNASANPAPDTKGGQHSGYFTCGAAIAPARKLCWSASATT